MRRLLMSPLEREGSSCKIIWQPSSLSLDEFAAFTDFLADLYTDIAVPNTANVFPQLAQSGELPSSPQVESIQMSSPLIAGLFSVDPLGILALGTAGYMLKHPEALGG
jgi:hypothetical protein